MKKIYNSIIVQTIITLVLSWLMMTVGQYIGIPVGIIFNSINNDALSFMGMYAYFIGIWIVVFCVWALVKKYRCLFRIFGPEAKGNKLSTSLTIGLIFGLGFNLLIAIIAAINGDIKLTFNEINIPYILGFIIAVCIQSGAEELVFRGHLYQNLRRIYPKIPIIAIAGNAIVFSLLHINNTGITILALINITVCGIMYSLMVYYFDSMWAPIIAHTGWNFCQSILLGLPNSGLVSAYSVFKLDAASAQDSFAYSVDFGIEGTAASALILAIGCVMIIILGRRRNQKPLDVWSVEAPKLVEDASAVKAESMETVYEKKETEE